MNVICTRVTWPCHACVSSLLNVLMDQRIWQWTLTKEAIAPCFVRDVLAMRRPTDKGTSLPLRYCSSLTRAGADYFWLGHTPCRTVVLVGMVVGTQVYEKRTIYTSQSHPRFLLSYLTTPPVDDGTAVIDCVLRHPHPTLPAPAPRSPPRSTGGPSAEPKSISSPKKPRLDKVKLESTEPPPPITEPGYPVRVVGRVVRHYESKQIHADTIGLFSFCLLCHLLLTYVQTSALPRSTRSRTWNTSSCSTRQSTPSLSPLSHPPNSLRDPFHPIH